MLSGKKIKTKIGKVVSDGMEKSIVKRGISKGKAVGEVRIGCCRSG